MSSSIVKTRLLLAPMLLAVVLLHGCADGGAVTSGGSGGCGIPLTSATGLWLGAGNFIGGGTTVAMIADGDLIVLQLVGDSPLNSPIVNRFYVGSYDVDTLSGTADVYDGPGRLVAAGQTLRISTSQTLNVTVGSSTTLLPLCPLIDGTANNVFDRPTVNGNGVNMVTGTWEFNFNVGQAPYTLNYTFDGVNNVTGNDTPGCLYNGLWADPNPLRNLYRIEDLDLTGQQPGACDGDDGSGQLIPFEGDGYNGFAFFIDANPAVYQTIWTIVANGEYAYFNRFTRTSAAPELPDLVVVPPPPPPPADDPDDNDPDDGFDPNFIPS